jgi:hypothetical protein
VLLESLPAVVSALLCSVVVVVAWSAEVLVLPMLALQPAARRPRTATMTTTAAITKYAVRERRKKG